MAHLLRADLIPPAYAPSKEIRAIKRVLRQRMFFVRVRTRAKNRIHALLVPHAVPRPEVRDLFGVTGRRWLQSLTLPAPDGTLLAEDLEVLGVLDTRIATTEELIAQLGKGDDLVHVLKTLPGIGDFFAVLIRYEVDEMRRFNSPAQFASYIGLVPATYASGDRMGHGHLTKRGNHWLRWALVEAVRPATQRSPSLRRFYDRLKARRGTKAARVATARKLAELTWYVWTERRPYQER